MKYAKTLVLGASVATAIAGSVAVAGPAAADVERHGRCGGASYELSVDREHGGFEVNAEVDHARAGSRWWVALRHDGHRFHARHLRADHEGEVDVERFRRNTAGKDRFVLRLVAPNGQVCKARITMR